MGLLKYVIKPRQRALSWAARAKARVVAAKIRSLGDAGSMLAYHQQGDASVNTSDAFTKRMRLRRDDAVVDILEKWWAMIISKAQQTRPNADRLLYDDYLTLHKALCLELLGEDEYDEDEAEESAQEEWAEDSSGDYMTRDQFMAGIFELADLWVPTIDANDYWSFLDDLLKTTGAKLRAPGYGKMAGGATLEGGGHIELGGIASRHTFLRERGIGGVGAGVFAFGMLRKGAGDGGDGGDGADDDDDIWEEWTPAPFLEDGAEPWLASARKKKTGRKGETFKPKLGGGGKVSLTGSARRGSGIGGKGGEGDDDGDAAGGGDAGRFASDGGTASFSLDPSARLKNDAWRLSRTTHTNYLTCRARAMQQKLIPAYWPLEYTPGSLLEPLSARLPPSTAPEPLLHNVRTGGWAGFTRASGLSSPLPGGGPSRGGVSMARGLESMPVSPRVVAEAPVSPRAVAVAPVSPRAIAAAPVSPRLPSSMTASPRAFTAVAASSMRSARPMTSMSAAAKTATSWGRSQMIVPMTATMSAWGRSRMAVLPEAESFAAHLDRLIGEAEARKRTPPDVWINPRADAEHGAISPPPSPDVVYAEHLAPQLQQQQERKSVALAPLQPRPPATPARSIRSSQSGSRPVSRRILLKTPDHPRAFLAPDPDEGVRVPSRQDGRTPRVDFQEVERIKQQLLAHRQEWISTILVPMQVKEREKIANRLLMADELARRQALYEERMKLKQKNRAAMKADGQELIEWDDDDSDGMSL